MMMMMMMMMMTMMMSVMDGLLSLIGFRRSMALAVSSSLRFPLFSPRLLVVTISTTSTAVFLVVTVTTQSGLHY